MSRVWVNGTATHPDCPGLLPPLSSSSRPCSVQAAPLQAELITLSLVFPGHFLKKISQTFVWMVTCDLFQGTYLVLVSDDI